MIQRSLNVAQCFNQARNAYKDFAWIRLVAILFVLRERHSYASVTISTRQSPSLVHNQSRIHAIVFFIAEHQLNEYCGIIESLR